ncbi:unannotated protein [freshwater metagenome]|uniref:Unannotated protein n=1 Tax=freshwater metagenome TaxID=449393 RepID=A0A6J7KGH5_9ZZZZ
MHSRSIPQLSGIATTPPRITGDTVPFMTDVSIRDLRNHGGEVIDRVLGGHDIVNTRSGRPVAQILPMRDRGTARSVLARWRPIARLNFDELHAGLEGRMARQIVLQQAEANFTAMPFSSEAARRYGQIAAALRASGRTVRTRAFDTLIAATRAPIICRSTPRIPPTSTSFPTSSWSRSPRPAEPGAIRSRAWNHTCCCAQSSESCSRSSSWPWPARGDGSCSPSLVRASQRSDARRTRPSGSRPRRSRCSGRRNSSSGRSLASRTCSPSGASWFSASPSLRPTARCSLPTSPCRSSVRGRSSAS